MSEAGSPAFPAAVEDAIAGTINADRVRVAFERYWTACADTAFLSTPAAATLVAALFDNSAYLTDLVVKRPEALAKLACDSLDSPHDRAGMAKRLSERIENGMAFERRLSELRGFTQEEILRIGAREVVLFAPVEEVTAELSALAEVTLEASIAAANADLAPRFGEPQSRDGAPVRFVALAMGKLGGRELNFSSDIDLVFLYEGEGETSGGDSRPISNGEYMQRLGERIIKAMSDRTSEGIVFRVDMRLRPHGRFAPLVVSFDSALDYYESQGRPWERQAFIKARPVAGDLGFGARFLESIRPFVYPRYFDDETLEDILEVKGQLEADVARRGDTEVEVKLGRGGIRDIEFTVQMLQLLNGGAMPALRTPNTLAAIGALGVAGIVPPFDAQTLERNYLFLRRIEHRLQIEGSQQRHALPKDDAVLDDFARRFGYESGDAFMNEYRGRAEETRGILERFFSAKGDGTLWIAELLNPNASAEDGLAKLSAMGFDDAAGARRDLIALHGGSAERPHSAHVRAVFRDIAPRLIDAVAGASRPDVVLGRLQRLFASLSAPGALYEVLNHDAQLADSLVTVVSNSNYLTECIVRDPGLFETFGNPAVYSLPMSRREIARELVTLHAAANPDAALYRLRDGQMLRVGMRELLNGASVETIGDELTHLAEVCVRQVYDEARARVVERKGPTAHGFAILGLGKLGGQEMGYGSDLDLVFVHESAPEAGEYFAAVASRMIKALNESTQYGKLYDVDARLRPDGNRGVLSVSLARLESYYHDEAMPWERLALMKARWVGGDEPFGEEAMAVAEGAAYERPWTLEDLESFEGIRRRLVEKAGPLDIKRGNGGIAALEFGVRLLQVLEPAVRGQSVLEVLVGLVAYGHLTTDEARQLAEMYEVLRRIENRIRMWDGTSGSVLPADEASRRDLAKRLGLEDGLDERVAACGGAIRAFYEDAYARLRDHLAT